MAISTRRGPEQPVEGIDLDLERNPDAPSVARAAIVGFCQNRKVPSGAVAILMLLVSEIVTNAVIHPDAPRETSIGFSARIQPNSVRIEVTDQGSGFTPRPRDPDQLSGGYGLYLLQEQAKRWGLNQQNGTTVWFEVST